MFKKWFMVAMALMFLLGLLLFGGMFVFNDGLKNLSAASDIYMMLGVAEVMVVIASTALVSNLGVKIVKKALQPEEEKTVAKEKTDAK